jgi:hypothetical protein
MANRVKKSIQPLARKASLIVQDLPDETLVYDQLNDKAHCLNATAAFVWKHCDGATTVHDIALLLNEQLDAPADDEMVWLALDRLEKSKLLAERLDRPADMALISRREIGRRLGLVGVLAVGLPLVTSIVAPNSAQAASKFANGVACSTSSQCISGCCASTGAGTCLNNKCSPATCLSCS